MKVLLVRPISRIKKITIIIPSLGLGYLATALRKDGHRVLILDCVKEKFDYVDFQEYLKKIQPDVVGFQLLTSDYISVKKMLSLTKKNNPKIMTLIGGPHVSGAPILTLQDMKDADYGFVGEAEYGVRELLVQKDPKTIFGLVYRDKKRVVVNPSALIEDIAALGFPSWDLMNPESYPLAPQGHFAKQSPTAQIITTRGCPYHCSYCAVVSNTGRKFRKRSVDSVIAEIELLCRTYGVREIHIGDDNFTLDKNYVMDFSKKLIQKNLGITWACPNGVRLDTLDKELLQIMEKSGCYSFGIGIESGSPKILNAMHRVVSVEKMKEKIQLVRKTTHIRMTGFFIIGYPQETKEDIQMSINFACSLPIQRVTFNVFLPLPGTEIYDTLIQENKISGLSLHTDDYSFDMIPYVPDGFTKKDIEGLRKEAFWRFYARPSIIYGVLQEIRTPAHALNIIKKIAYTFV